jgi:hypothetical protein
MNAETLIATAEALVAGDKGLLAMDESDPACNERCAGRPSALVRLRGPPREPRSRLHHAHNLTITAADAGRGGGRPDRA